MVGVGRFAFRTRFRVGHLGSTQTENVIVPYIELELKNLLVYH